MVVVSGVRARATRLVNFYIAGIGKLADCIKASGMAVVGLRLQTGSPVIPANRLLMWGKFAVHRFCCTYQSKGFNATSHQKI